MKIWHIGASASPKRVSGASMVAWQLAREQAKLGHQVTLLLHSPPGKAGQDYAAQAGVTLLYVPASLWRYDPNILRQHLRDQSPDVVHMHSVFQSRQVFLAMQLAHQSIPYVITPAGGLLPQVLKRKRWQKLMFSWLFEKRRFQNAGAIAVVTPREEENVRAFVPRYEGMIRWMPNPVDTQSLGDQRWQGIHPSSSPHKVVYLGRFDVLHKGIDRLVAIARHLPQVEFHLYGTVDAKTQNWLHNIRDGRPDNVFFHAPVYGSDKFRVLAEASLYIQSARWEVFGMSIAEAMYLGTPCAVADSINFAELFQRYNLGLVFSNNLREAAAYIAAALNEPERLQQWSLNAQSYARQHFEPETVANDHLRLYQDVLSSGKINQWAASSQSKVTVKL